MKQEIIIKVENCFITIDSKGIGHLELLGLLELVKMQIINEMITQVK